MKIGFFSVLLFLFSLSSFSNCRFKLNGELFDGETNTPIESVLITLLPTGIQTFSDKDGSFYLKDICKGEYEIVLQLSGYKTIKLPLSINSNVHQDFVLHADTCLLNSVTILHRSQNNIGKSKHAINEDQLANKSGSSLGELLKDIPGVNITQTGPNVFKPMIDGLTNNRILYLQNDVKLESQQWGNDHAPEIDASGSQKIQVIKGASAVKYGSDAIAGVIDLIPSPLRSKNGIDAYLQNAFLTNNRLYLNSATVNAASKLGQARIQLGQKNAGFIQTPHYRLDNTSMNEQNGLIHLKKSLKKWDSELYATQLNSQIGVYSGAHVSTIEDLLYQVNKGRPDKNVEFSRSLKAPYQKVSHSLFKAKTTYTYQENAKVEIQASIQNNIREEYDNERVRSFREGKPSVSFNMITKNILLNLETVPSSKLTSIYGIQVMDQKNITEVSSVKVFVPNFRTLSSGIYSIQKIKKKNIDLEIGARYDFKNSTVYQYNKNEIKSTNLQFHNYAIAFNGNYNTKLTNTKFELSSSFRTPSVNELFSDGVHHGLATYEIGNLNLKPEHSYQTSVDETIGIGKLQFKAHFFANYLKNYIYTKPSFPPYVTIRGAFPTMIWTQTDALLSGIDIQNQYSISKIVSLQSTLNYLNSADFNKNNDPLPLMPPLKFSQALKFNFPSKWIFKNTELEFNYDWVDKSVYLLNDKKSIQLTNSTWEYNGDYAPLPASYWVWNSSFSTSIYRKNKKKAQVGIAFTNIFNNEYRNYLNRLHYFMAEKGTDIQFRLKIMIE